MHTHTLILLERLSSLTMSTTCTKNSEARTAKNPQSWTIESNLSRHCSRWFLNDFDMRANSRRGALLPTMSVTVGMTDETPKCFICLPGAHRNVPSVRSLAWKDFFCTREAAAVSKRFQLLTLKRQPSLLFQPWSLPANVDVEGSAVTPHVVRHSARKRKTRHL